MSTKVYVIIAIVIMGLFILRRMKKAAGIAVLKTKIGTSDGLNYEVLFVKIHPETKEIEYVRMALNFTAKILFIIQKKDEYVSSQILDFLKKVSETEMTPKDIDRFIPNGISITVGSPKGKVTEGVLYFKDMRTRNVMTKLPPTWFEYQLAHTVIALIKVTVEKLDDFHRECLKNSLKFMADKYESGVNPKEISVMVNLPNESFLSRHF